MMTGTERWESHESGQLRADCSVYKKRIAERGNKLKRKRDESTAAVQGVVVETLEHEDGILIESRLGFVSDNTSTVTVFWIFNRTAWVQESAMNRTWI